VWGGGGGGDLSDAFGNADRSETTWLRADDVAVRCAHIVGTVTDFRAILIEHEEGRKENVNYNVIIVIVVLFGLFTISRLRRD
jgi:hypothetical protein